MLGSGHERPLSSAGCPQKRFAAYLDPLAQAAHQSLHHLAADAPWSDEDVLLVGLAVLLVFVNVYMVTKRLDIRRAREHLISTTIQSELVRPQSFTDPLTEFTTATPSTRWLGDLSTMPCVRTDRSRSC